MRLLGLDVSQVFNKQIFKNHLIGAEVVFLSNCVYFQSFHRFN